MTKLDVYTIKGTKKSTAMNLPKEFVEKENFRLLAQAVRVFENRFHAKNAVTKRRGEITASTRKIYAQKGTGRARHGAISAPIFVGGAKAHGPDGRSKILKLSKNMARKAFSVALSQKAKEGTLLVVEGIDGLKKTKEAALFIKKILSSIKKEGCKNITIALSGSNDGSKMFLRNIGGVTVESFSDLNAYKVYKSEVLILSKNALDSKIKKVKNQSIKAQKTSVKVTNKTVKTK